MFKKVYKIDLFIKLASRQIVGEMRINNIFFDDDGKKI